MVAVVEYPITVYVDNVGAIFLLENISVSQRMKHIYVLYQFICDYIEYRIVKIQLFYPEENLANIFTKNLSIGNFESLTSRYVHLE